MDDPNDFPITYRGEFVGSGRAGLDAAYDRAVEDGLIKTRPPEPPHPADLTRTEFLRGLLASVMDALDDACRNYSGDDAATLTDRALAIRNALDDAAASASGEQAKTFMGRASPPSSAPLPSPGPP